MIKVRQVRSRDFLVAVVPAGYENPSKADGLLKGPWSIPGWELRSHVPLQSKNKNINNRSNVVRL